MFVRNDYGQLTAQASAQWLIHGPSRDTRDGLLMRAAEDLVAQAASAGKIDPSHDSLSWDRKGRAEGDATHHEIYDVTPDGRRALVCIRTTEGGRYGVRTTSKNYCVVARHGRGVRVIQANKAVAAKAAKAAGLEIGTAIEVALGRARLPVKPTAVRTGYKLLERTAAPGVYRSAWDGSRWTRGQSRVEAASDDHTGGYYYYASLDECLAAAAANDVFGAASTAHRLAIVEVQATGRHYAHRATHGTKLCASRVVPIAEIGSTL